MHVCVYVCITKNQLKTCLDPALPALRVRSQEVRKLCFESNWFNRNGKQGSFNFLQPCKNNSVLMNQLQVLHNKAAKIILDAHPLSSASESLLSLNWQPLATRRHLHRCLIMHKCLNNDIDFKFNFKFSSDIHSYNTRNKQNIHLERVKKNWGKQAFSYHAANDWNSLPVEIRNIQQIKTFKTKLKKHLAT